MANVKITELTALTAADSASTDVLPIVDVSADATKKLAISDLHRSVPDGTLSAPGIAFQSDLNSGLYRSGTDAIALVTNGAARILIDATGDVTIPNDLTIQGATTCAFAAGTAAAPSITFVDDSDTGLYRPAANEIGLATAGTDRVRIDSSGNVGIGDSSPANTLSVLGASTTGGSSTGNVAEFAGPSNTNGFQVFVNDTNNNSGIQTKNGDALIINPHGGNVGIGTTSPGQLLHLSSPGFPTIRVTDADNSTYFDIANSDGDIILKADEGNTFASSAIRFMVDATERMRIDSDGRVGIGTASPKMQLQTGTSGGFQASAAGELAIRYNMYYSSGDKYIGSSGKASSLVMNSNGEFIFYNTNTASTSANSAVSGLGERMRIDSSGNVGIGTTSPSENLHIKDAGFAGIIVQSDRTTAADNIGGFILRDSVGNNKSQVRGTVGGDLAFDTNATEAARIDSSGRLLVGTSSFTGEASAVLEGSSAGVTTQAQLWLNRGSTPTTDNVLGQIIFGDNTAAGRNGAMIQARADLSWNTNDYPSRLAFSTTADGSSSPTERMRITSDGALLVNTSSTNISSNERLTVNGISTFYRASGTAVYFKRTGNDGDVTLFFRDTTGVGSISVTTTATAYNTSSDYRLKENVIPVTDGIARLQQLKPSRFNFIADPDKTVDGFLAHEVQTIVPEAITGEKDAVDDEGNPQYQGIDQSKLVPLLTAALQEAIGEIESLKARVAALEAS